MKVDVAIIGAGSAGLSALRQVRTGTESYTIIDRGPLGTTCARTGCMPSKTLIHIANEFHRRRDFPGEGLLGAGQIECDLPFVMQHVRGVRDNFAGGMADTVRKLAGDHLIEGQVRFLSPTVLEVGGQHIEAGRIIIATGSSPMVPQPWRGFGNRLLTSENLFEQETLPECIAVVGLGAIGLELGQAFARLGLEVQGFDLKPTLGGLSDPTVSGALHSAIETDFPVHTGAEVEVEETNGGLRVTANGKTFETHAVLAAMGVVPNIEGLNLEALGVELDDKGMPPFNADTGQIADRPVFMAGDVNGNRPILHEAIDEGFLAGQNALQQDNACAARRVPLAIVFSDPEAMVVGKPYSELEHARIVVGKVDYSDQSRAVIEGRNRGLLHLYAEPKTGRLLGAEAAAPGAADLGHLLAFAIQQEATVFDLLQMPFYHPTVTEALRTALRDAAEQCRSETPKGIALFDCGPESPL